MADVEVAREARIQRITLELMLLSVALITVAMIWTWNIGLQANDIQHRLGHATDNLAAIRQVVAKMEAHQR